MTTTCGAMAMQTVTDAARGRCGICGWDGLEQLCETAHGTVVRCENCKTARTLFRKDAPLTQQRYDDARWVETRDILSGRLCEQARDRYELLGRFNPGRDLLEVGCSTGEFLEAAAMRGHDVTGVEISPGVVEHVKAVRPGTRIMQCRLEDAGLKPGSFDAVAAFHLLEHIEDPEEFLSRVRALLRPNGLLYVRVPNLDSWFRKIFGASWWGFSESHVWHFSAGGLSRLLERASFEVAGCGNCEDVKESYWPVLPLLAGRGRLIRKVGNLVAPATMRRGAGPGADGGEDARKRVKKALLCAYMYYRRLGSKALLPLISLQERSGGGSELYAVARKAEL